MLGSPQAHALVEAHGTVLHWHYRVE